MFWDCLFSTLHAYTSEDTNKNNYFYTVITILAGNGESKIIACTLYICKQWKDSCNLAFYLGWIRISEMVITLTDKTWIQLQKKWSGIIRSASVPKQLIQKVIICRIISTLQVVIQKVEVEQREHLLNEKCFSPYLWMKTLLL